MHHCVHARMVVEPSGDLQLYPMSEQNELQQGAFELRYLTIAYDDTYAAVAVCNPIDMEKFSKGTGKNYAVDRLNTIRTANMLRAAQHKKIRKDPKYAVAIPRFRPLKSHKDLINNFLQPLRERRFAHA